MNRYLVSALAISSLASTTLADIPNLGGPMSHLLITVFNNEVFVTFESPSLATVDMQSNTGDFTGSSSVLNDFGYNGQFGWLANGFISLPPSSGIFVRALGHSEHLDVYEEHTFNPIFGTDDSDDTWQWNGTMVHNWYATQVQGTHWASYEVYVGDLLGNPLAGFTSGFVDLQFQYGSDLSDRIGTLTQTVTSTPSPSSVSLLSVGVLMGTHRRR